MPEQLVYLAVAVAAVVGVDSFIPMNLLSSLPLGVALVIATQSPWILAVLTNKLRPGAQFAEQLAIHEKALAAAIKDRDDWKDAWAEERARGDAATIALSEASTESAKSLLHLAKAVGVATPSTGATAMLGPGHPDA